MTYPDETTAHCVIRVIFFAAWTAMMFYPAYDAYWRKR